MAKMKSYRSRATSGARDRQAQRQRARNRIARKIALASQRKNRGQS